MDKMTFDYETRSEIDIKKIGASLYARHPSTEPMCFSYSINKDEPKLWRMGDKAPNDFIKFLNNPKNIIGAHNAGFEYLITKFVLPKFLDVPKVHIERFRCTAAKAAACSLPRKLEKACEVLDLTEKKDMVGHRLMLKHTKPRTAWKDWDNAGRLWQEPKKYFDDEIEREIIYKYCIQDVKAEIALDERLPDLSPYEQEVWTLNQKMNFRGIQIDIETVKKIIKMIELTVIKSHEKVKQITKGKVDSALQVQKLLKYLQSIGYNFENLKAPTVKLALASEDISDDIYELLNARQIASKTSTKKFYAMVQKAHTDNRVRDLTMYHGANTGRESGTGLQIQNLAKGNIKDTDKAIEFIKENELEDIELYYAKPMDLFSSCIRGMITASPGHELFVSDYNAIECRIVNWLAGHESVIQTFREFDVSGDIEKCPYRIMASRILGKPVKNITDGERFLGKTAELGCGYQMGDSRFYQTCIEWGVPDVTKKLAKKAVQVYRDTHQPVKQLWFNYENAAIQAVTTKKKVTVNRCSFHCSEGFLWITLPSGRRLAYYRPSIKMEMTPWNERRPKLYYWYMDQNKWVKGASYGGLLTENICQATARDVAVNGTKLASNGGFKYMFQVHDEVISEAVKGEKNLKEYNDYLSRVPTWAIGLPIRVGGWNGFRYKK